MATLTVRGFERPDEVRTFEKGRLEIIHLGDLAVGRLTQEPGWHWAEHVGPITGTWSCQSHHIGFVILGKAHVVMDDGSETDLVPGAAIEISPGHDAWVVGDEPHVTLEFSGVRAWARPPDWTGDGVLVMFPSAVRAVHAGLAIRAVRAARGLAIRTGVHTGVVMRSTDDVRGLAVHVAARIMALAEADEVLISATTRDLAEAAGVTFHDRGIHVLKDVTGTKQVFNVEPIAS